MTIRPIYTSGHPHGRFNVDPSQTFEAGMVGELSVDALGNPVVVLAGTKPLGLIEDQKATAFTQPIIGERHVVATVGGATVLLNNGSIVAGSQLVFLLSAAGVPSAVAETTDYTIALANGVITVVATGAIDTATPYLDADGDSVADSVEISVNYRHAVPGVAGSDSTLGSGLVTLHFQRGEFSVGVYDTAATYAVNDKLYVGDGGAGNAPLGVLTVAANTTSTQVVGICTQPPTASNPQLQLITDFDYGTWA